MKLKEHSKRIPANKQKHQLSLPKLQSRLLTNAHNYQLQRLHFPIRDDSSLIGGVGKKHFYSNSSSLQKIINPQSKEYLDRNYFSLQPLAFNSNNKINKFYENLLLKKLQPNGKTIKTLPTQAPFALDYPNRGYIKKQNNQGKGPLKIQPKRLKSEYIPVKIENSDFNKKINKAQFNNAQKMEIISKKQLLTQPITLMDSKNHRSYNPTYISSNF